MKSLLTILMACSIVFSSCTKEHQEHEMKQDSCCKPGEKKSATAEEKKESYYDIEGLSYTDDNGVAFQLSSLKNNYVFVSMVFTNCAYACPRIAENIIALEKAVGKPAKVLLVSFDPKRDTPKRMKEFLKEKNAGDNWRIITSNSDIVRQTSMLFDISFKELETGDFSHENVILLLDKQGREIKRIEGLTFDIQQEASEILHLMEQSK